MYIQPHHRCRARGRGKASPALFENRKEVLILKKSPDCFDLWVKFFIQNVLLKSRRKISKILPCGASFCCVFDMFSCVFDMFLKCLLKCPSSATLLPSPVLIHYSFCKTLHFKCLMVFWICLCFDNCPVICVVTLCYVKQQTHSQFWHIQYCFSGICQHVKSHSTLLRHIHAYWGIIKVYSDLFRHIQHAV